MSDRKYTPMEILRDYIKLRINSKDVRWVPNINIYHDIINMIEGNSLGKPLLEQEAEMIQELKEQANDKY